MGFGEALRSAEFLILVLLGLLALVVWPMSVVVPAQSAAVIERRGQFLRVAPMGLTFKMPLIDKVRAVVDLKNRYLTVPGRAHASEDGRTLYVNAIVDYRVEDPSAYIYGPPVPAALLERAAAAAIDAAPPVSGGTLTRTWTDTLNSVLVRSLEQVAAPIGVRILGVRTQALES